MLHYPKSFLIGFLILFLLIIFQAVKLKQEIIIDNQECKKTTTFAEFEIPEIAYLEGMQY